MPIVALIFVAAAALLGLLLGSFLNVCISRLPRHKSLTRPRSHCPQCLATIRWYDNIPLLSWRLLAAKCRDCKAGIPWRYPAVELATALWFAQEGAVWWHLVIAKSFRYELGASYITNVTLIPLGSAILGFLLIGLMVMDWQTHTLPDAFTWTGSVIGFVFICIRALFLAPGELDIHFDPQHSLRLSSPGSFVAKGDVFMTGPEHLVLGRLLAILSAAGLLLLVRWAYRKLRGREGLGLGDAKLLAMIAAFLGFWPAMLALFLGVVLCSLFALPLLLRGRASAATRLPLGTFLCLGGLITAVAGTPLLAWYQSLL